ncbi:serine/threonine-protein phosphatase PP-Z1 [Spizellomyces punctatus DAOM BR117]|uniref:protein-serine/threonine phosphatase n=1 Tax=Spizellomyces punctatus (strain DAOM BR117) TaxID=645134 RepID=A0A0L0HM49_SPIPD|nr:serine/threonine-protein phosphatase PP-Z1 [Spizellomyces punctatus DAOM BR117]KND02516.1 serine/threonine-protein phosphatase PP-Z1 [Spizellomyces punctatus DAOM BR117]|eukprot:XP_016610555.1 serine/threonine-protein phosphatase PP-Z1 [Spizellomyces punctatus DAOM BR117]
MGSGNSKIKNGKRKSISSFAEKDVAELTTASVQNLSSGAAVASKDPVRRFSAPASISGGGDDLSLTESTEIKKGAAVPVPTPTSPPPKHLGSPPPNFGDQDADDPSSAGEESDPTNPDDTANNADDVPSSPISESPASPRTAFSSSFGGRIGPKDKYDLDDIIARLLDARNHKVSKSLCLKNSEVLSVCHKAREVFMSQPILLELLPPVNIVGAPCQVIFTASSTTFCEYSTFADILPARIIYSWRRCNLKVWKVFTDVFNCLPIAALVAGKIFCVHGGLSPSLHSMDDIRAVARPSDVPDFGLLNDLLWSDPSDLATDWEDNERGVSYCFSKTIVSEFLSRHDLDLVCRAHMVVEEGYEFFNNRTLVTVFSAPNYCGEFDNKGAVMCVNEDLLCSFEILQPQTHPKHSLKGRRRLSPPMLNKP